MGGSRFMHPTAPGGVLSLFSPVLKPVAYTPAAAGTATLNLANGGFHSIQMPAGNITIAFSNISIGRYFVIRIIQDAVGSRTVTWPAGMHWPGGSAPTLATVASHWDDIQVFVTASGAYDAMVIGANMS